MEIFEGLNDGARNMIGIAIATATAGIIVGGITLTGSGFPHDRFRRGRVAGQRVVMLLFTAFVCLVLGLGVPTTANYILVATLMAPVIVELGAQSGLVIPLIAVHLFVFYYGIMGDITPPVGLASFAAAAISGEDAIKTGLQGSLYALRTVVLPFVFVFNPTLLLIDVESWPELVLVALAATAASLVFAAATLGWFRTALPLVGDRRAAAGDVRAVPTGLLHGQDCAPYSTAPAKDIVRVAQSTRRESAPGHGHRGDDARGRRLAQDGRGADSARRERAASGWRRRACRSWCSGDDVRVAAVRFGSRARKSGFEQGSKIDSLKVPTDRPSQHWIYLPALLLVALVFYTQGRRLRRA